MSTSFAAGLALLLSARILQGQDLSARLDSTMRVAEAGGFSGVVRIERAGTVLLKRGYGFADRAQRVPFSPETVVQIGSNTKDFTAVAILQLQERGLLSVRDSLGKYFPAAPADKRDITLQQLLEHRAGFPLGVGGDFEPWGRQALLDSALHVRLLFAPGARESYSNTGFSLLAAVIEQVTGRSYDAQIEQAILAPLGLRRTGLLRPGFAARDLAHGYLASGADAGTMLDKPHATDGPYWNLRGNGGMLSTVDDMHAFYTTLFDGERLVTRAARGQRFNPDEPTALAGSDGVNFFLYDRETPSRTEIIIASTNAVAKAPMIRRELGRVLGLPDPESGGPQVARRPGAKPAAGPIAELLQGLVATINSADSSSVRRFVRAHFAAAPDDAKANERVQRIAGMRDRLGALTIVAIETFDEGPAEIRLTSTQQESVLLRVMMDREAPYMIRGLQALVGGAD